MASEQHEFIEKAQTAAESIVKGWIRGVFRETSLQVLRQQWDVKKGEDDILELGIEPYMLDECNSICHKLANNWERRLIEQDQSQVAAWVHEIASENNFWSCDNETIDGGRKTPVHEKDSKNEDILSAENKADEIAQEVEDAEEPQSSKSEPELPLTKLWHLLHNESDLEVLNKRIAQMGRDGDTQWPGDWKSVENICNKLKLRLHSKSPRVRFEIVPKEMAAPEEQKEEVDVVPSARLRNLLEKKKRKLYMPSDQAPNSSANKRARVEEQLIEKARPPSKQPAQEKWRWESIKQSIKDEDKYTLENEYIHDSGESDPSNIILGVLLPLGLNHYNLSGGDQYIADLSGEKKKRLTRRKIINERLESKKIIRNERKRPVSKVIRTQLEDEQYVELDLGECMFELNGKLHAFASVEISLSDGCAPDE